ncbi:MAG TPA: acyl-CoA dehydrogenase family protein [Candidatus Binatia bacterium]|nr:acyl-CoA dehydrogenase family protein [Candidatus Binatia bacterium]
MDFGFTPEQEALRELARTIFADHLGHERLKALEAAGKWYDDACWRALAQARLLGVAVPEAHGGSGLGLIELALLLEEAGRAVAPLPLVPTLVLGALPLAAFGTPEQQRRWLPGVADGEVVLSAGLAERESDDPAAPAATARCEGSVWRLDGVKLCVPAAERAARVLVPARTGEGRVGVFLVDPRGPGAIVERQLLTNGEPHGRLTLAGATVAAADVLGDLVGGAALVRWIVARALAAYAALQVGVCERALRMAAEYTAGREQFGRPIASFQAVHQRAADAFIDLEAMRLAAWEAIDRLGHDEPAEDAVTIAKFWAAEGGQHVAVAAQHLHGGIGVDVDYPLHRYFLWAKHLELVLGAAPQQLARLGMRMAEAQPGAPRSA